jgi:hypothetical protein
MVTVFAVHLLKEMKVTRCGNNEINFITKKCFQGAIPRTKKTHRKVGFFVTYQEAIGMKGETIKPTGGWVFCGVKRILSSVSLIKGMIYPLTSLNRDYLTVLL